MVKELLTKLLKNIFAILGFMTSLLSGLNWKYNLTFIVTGLLISAIIYLLFELNEVDNKKYFKVKGRVPGNGLYNELNLIRIESNPKLSTDTLLTLISQGNGLTNPICILKIIYSLKGEEIQAIQLLPNEANMDLSEYFVDSNQLDKLYVTRVINENHLQIFNIKNNETI